MHHKPDNLTDFSEIDWLSLSSGEVDNKVSFFVNDLNELYCSCFQLINKHVSAKIMMRLWLSPSILSLFKIKKLYFKFYKQSLITRELKKNWTNSRIQSIINKSKRSYCLNSLLTGGGDSART